MRGGDEFKSTRTVGFGDRTTLVGEDGEGHPTCCRRMKRKRRRKRRRRRRRRRRREGGRSVTFVS